MNATRITLAVVFGVFGVSLICVLADGTWPIWNAVTDLWARIWSEFEFRTLIALMAALSAAAAWPNGESAYRRGQLDRILFERHWGGLGSAISGVRIPAWFLLRACAAGCLWLLGAALILLPAGKADAEQGRAKPIDSAAPSKPTTPQGKNLEAEDAAP